MPDLPNPPAASPGASAILLFDIDGVIRNVGGSYRRAIQATVRHFCGWTPGTDVIDRLKGEGLWNNDWDASRELLRRHQLQAGAGDGPRAAGDGLPSLEEVAAIFSGFYFGGDPLGPPAQWNGFIREETLLVDPAFFLDLDAAGMAWGFVSGAEAPSARFLLEERLGLRNPPLVAMEDAPQKPDPTGLLALAERLAARWGHPLGPAAPPVAYVGDTVADVETVRRARRERPDQRFLALAVAPPHLHAPEQAPQRRDYERQLLTAGADHLLASTASLSQDPESLIAALLAHQDRRTPAS
ncbi:MAG: TIGR01548 family HAD-type hydrolase [Cyanobacteriota bacterium]|nr:TIGR01548 family HAD-type hydrolase [Cyanobacteriota bacterium]